MSASSLCRSWLGTTSPAIWDCLRYRACGYSSKSLRRVAQQPAFNGLYFHASFAGTAIRYARRRSLRTPSRGMNNTRAKVTLFSRLVAGFLAGDTLSREIFLMHQWLFDLNLDGFPFWSSTCLCRNWKAIIYLSQQSGHWSKGFACYRRYYTTS